jgi:hypothetical protein
MIYHSIRVSYKDDISETDLQAALDQWHTMAKAIPEVEFYCIGRDIGGEYEHGAMFALKDFAAYEAFLMHPEGKKTDLMGLPLVKDIAGFDLTDDDDPELAQKIADLHRTRFENDPELLAVFNDLTYTGSGSETV